MLRLRTQRRITDAMYYWSLRYVASWSKEDIDSFKTALSSTNRPSVDSHAKELNLVGCFALLTFGLAVSTLPASLLPLGSTAHSVSSVLYILLGTWVILGMMLHALRYYWAKHVYNKEMRQFRAGRTDFSDLRGDREYSSDMDFVYLTVATALLAILF